MKHINKQIDFWKKSAKRSLETAEDLYKTKHRDSCLFFCHLALEKILKGLVVQKTKQFAPYIHDLAKLSLIAKLNLTDEQIKNLRIITTFNIAGRYDEEKFNFYKKCTLKFTEKYLQITHDFFICLKKKYPKK